MAPTAVTLEEQWLHPASAVSETLSVAPGLVSVGYKIRTLQICFKTHAHTHTHNNSCSAKHLRIPHVLEDNKSLNEGCPHGISDDVLFHGCLILLIELGEVGLHGVDGHCL